MHVLASQSRSWGGPPVMVANLTRGLLEHGVESAVVTLGERLAPTVEFPTQVHVRNFGTPLVSRLGVPYNLRIISAVIEEVRKADVVHLHEIWHLPQLVAGLVSRAMDRNYLITPHGGLKSPVVGQYGLSKNLLWQLYQKKIVENASVIHALTIYEEESLRAAGLDVPTRVVPNGIDLQLVDAHLRRGDGWETIRSVANGPYILFLGRLHRKKGLDILLDAFSKIARTDSRIQLLIGGPDPSGLWQSLSARVAELGLAGRVKYVGFVDELSKYALMANALLFVLPSAAEGLSMASLEALACRTPVITSTTSNIPEVEKTNSGRVVEPTPKALARAMFDVLSNDSLRESMRSNARKLVETNFSSLSMAAALLQLYREMF